MAISTIEKGIFRLSPWFHNLHLPDGYQTAPGHKLGDFPAFKWQKLASSIPERLDNWEVLDIGCNAGFYSFELAKRGANVLGIDIDTHYLKQANWAAKIFGLEEKVKFKQMQVYDLAKTKKKYDMILFMGLLYHLRYPFLALDIITQRVEKLFVMQTLTMPDLEIHHPAEDYDINDREDLLRSGWPKMAFIEKKLAGDSTNWWVANPACVEAMLRSCGMKIVSKPLHETFICRPDEDNPSCIQTWNRSEYLSAVQREWMQEVKRKTDEKNIKYHAGVQAG